jgi:serine/threonine-protein kinase
MTVVPISRFRIRLRDALLPDYELGPELPGAGMSRVFRARDLSLGRLVALKIVHPDVARRVGIEHFRREIAVTAHLLHPHIVPLLAAGDVDGLFWYTMPLVTGESLRARLFREGQLRPGLAVRLAVEVAEALDYAHRQGVIHRDIKPENILLQDNHAMVLDFGIAAAASTRGAPLEGQRSGTPGYMSPEQMLGEPVDGRADIYSLARTFAEMVTGELPEGPFDGRGRIPRDMAAVVRRALEPDPDKRYPTAAQFAEDLSPCGREMGWWERLVARLGVGRRT